MKEFSWRAAALEYYQYVLTQNKHKKVCFAKLITQQSEISATKFLCHTQECSNTTVPAYCLFWHQTSMLPFAEDYCICLEFTLIFNWFKGFWKHSYLHRVYILIYFLFFLVTGQEKQAKTTLKEKNPTFWKVSHSGCIHFKR